MPQKRRVLAIDDSRSILLALTVLFRTFPEVEFRTRDHTLGQSETSEILAFNPHLVIMDLDLPLLGGAKFIPMLRSMGWNGALFIYSSESAQTILHVVTKEHALGWQKKGGTLAQLGDAIKVILAKLPESIPPHPCLT